MTLDPAVKGFLERLHQRSPMGTKVDYLSEVAERFGIRFPADYVDFMAVTNGGTGPTEPGYLSLWRAEDITPYNESYRSDTPFGESFVLFGDDGGGELYGLRVEDGLILEIPATSADPDDARECGNSLAELIHYIQRTSVVTPETQAMLDELRSQESGP